VRILKKALLLISLLAVAAIFVLINSAAATRPPTSPGQPNQNCEALPPQYEPPGFTTDGFALYKTFPEIQKNI
jgi:hypothetical protein